MIFKDLQNELIKATKEKDVMKKTVLKDIIAYAMNMAIEKGCKDNITEEIVTDAILKSKKVCQEQIDTCPSNRTDLLKLYKSNMEIVNEFTPKMMSENEVRRFVEEELKELTSTNIVISPQIKGLVMKNIMPKLKGKADGKMINNIVTELLAK